MLRFSNGAIFNRNKCHTFGINCIMSKFMLSQQFSSPFYAFLDCSLASLRLDTHHGGNYLICSLWRFAVRTWLKLLGSKVSCCIAVGVDICERTVHDEKLRSQQNLCCEGSDNENGSIFDFGITQVVWGENIILGLCKIESACEFGAHTLLQSP